MSFGCPFLFTTHYWQLFHILDSILYASDVSSMWQTIWLDEPTMKLDEELENCLD
jgi:hypothetical protein